MYTRHERNKLKSIVYCVHPFLKFLVTIFGYILLRRLMGKKIRMQIITYIFIIQVIMLPSLYKAVKTENFVILENIVEFVSVILLSVLH